VSRLIIVFGNVAEEWVRARLGEAVKIAITEDCPLKACGIYFAPPRRKASDGKFNLGFLPAPPTRSSACARSTAMKGCSSSGDASRPSS
jgi:hypothetical protein